MSISFDVISEVTKVSYSEMMSRHTTFSAGGPADGYVEVSCADELVRLVSLCHENDIPYIVLGNGSNVLFTDKGYRGLVIHVGREMSDITVSGNRITAEAGAMLSKVSSTAQEAGLSRLEFAAGIPGSVGGGLYMNAGAYGGEMKDVVVYADVCDKCGNVIRLTKDELKLAYRSSIIEEEGYVVLSVCMELEPDDKEAILARMQDYNTRRKTKQPLAYKSAGSTFKRPEGHFAGALIEQCGLKGYACGSAEVSELHAGFVINKNDASAQDILNVIKHVQDTVFKETGVMLEPEVQIIGE
ncbi:MAG: UDP-N-acetylmuramate dehydrogenase [Lachnospiraceae bacterium]|nr:UDP-N-acetylmuramate dehydrogenase [Lachnospiraceae bacterium]